MRRLLLVAMLLAAPLFVRAQQPSPHAWSPYADVILTNGSVTTVDKDFTIAQALAIKDGRLIVVGTNAEALATRGPATKVVDLHGRTVIPGLQDSHIHFLPLGEEVTREADFTYAKSAADIITGVEQVVAKVHPKPGDWIRGSKWDQYKYPQMVTRWELDKVAPDNPMWLSRTYRGIAVNTAVFRLMGIDDAKKETWPAWWLKDPADFTPEDRIYREQRTITFADGHTEALMVPAGVFLGVRGAQLLTVHPKPYTFEEDVESVRDGAKEMLSLGVTSIVDPASRMGYNMQVYQEASNRGWVPFRISAVYEGIFTTQTPDWIREHLAGIHVNNLGNHFLRWRGTKFYADGGAGTRSSWISEPFVNWQTIEGKPNTGLPVMRDTATREAQYRAALAYGWDLHTHATGDRAMRQVVDLYMKFLDEFTAAHPGQPLPRWSVIHAYLPIEPKTMVLPDMVRYHIIAVTNAVFQWQQGFGFVTNLGEARMARTQPFRTYLHSGVLMASGSDYSVTTHNPWMGFYALLTRRDQTTGKVYGPDETVGIDDALRSYTINGAYLTYEEQFKGSLEAGKVADLVVLDLPDVKALQENPELCFQMRDKVLLTMVEGQVRYRKQGYAF
ncbi:MAG: amidohydrolase [Acidobacteriota bacterium]|nr:amidohydrolase [Acidobacteriota bacterium]